MAFVVTARKFARDSISMCNNKLCNTRVSVIATG